MFMKKKKNLPLLENIEITGIAAEGKHRNGSAFHREGHDENAPGRDPEDAGGPGSSCSRHARASAQVPADTGDEPEPARDADPGSGSHLRARQIRYNHAVRRP